MNEPAALPERVKPICLEFNRDGSVSIFSPGSKTPQHRGTVIDSDTVAAALLQNCTIRQERPNGRRFQPE